MRGDVKKLSQRKTSKEELLMDKCLEEYFLLGNEFIKSEEFENYNIRIEKSLYEVIRISDGIPIFLMEHLKRLENSAEIMSYTLDITSSEIINGILELVKMNKVIDGNLKLVVNYKASKFIEDNKNNEANKFTEVNTNDKDDQELKGKLLIFPGRNMNSLYRQTRQLK